MLIPKKNNMPVISSVGKLATSVSLVTLLAACGAEPNVVTDNGATNVSNPVVQEPTVNQPITQTPVTQTPTTTDPVEEVPVTQTPTTADPVEEVPVTQTPTTADPVEEVPVTQTPTTADPVEEVPVTQTPTTTDPVEEVPSSQTPTTSEPVVEEVPSSQTPMTEPETDVPETTTTPESQPPVIDPPFVEEPASDAQNILSSDGTFASGQQNFQSFFNQEAGASTTDWMNQVAVNIVQLSSMAWHVQLQHSTSVVKDTLYTVCADVKAEDTRTFEFVIDAAGDGGYASLNAIALGAEANAVTETADTQWQTFKYTFYANATDETARLIFSLGSSDISMTFDNIGMYEGDQCGDPSNVKPVEDTSLAIADIPSSGRVDCPAPPSSIGVDRQAAGIPNLTFNTNQLKDRFETQTPFESSRWTLPWDLFEPDAATNNSANEKFPLLVVLHGGYGSEGADGNVTRDVLRYAVGSEQNGLLGDTNLNRFPTYIVAPHCRMSKANAPVVVNGQVVEQPLCSFGINEWASGGGKAGFKPDSDPSLAGGAVIELVEHMIKNYDVDPTRIYLTGNSMGGGGTWDMLIRRPDLFAAALPVSGHTPNPEYFKSIADSKIPVWAFAGKNDTTNPVFDTRAAAQAISEQGGCFYYTEYANAAHNDALWSGPYLESDVWTWLFSQSLPQSNEPSTPNSNVPNEGVSADYEAPKTDRAPVIDGSAEALWNSAPWEAIDTPWLFDSLTVPSSAADFNGRYKAMWDANKLYVLVEITDDKVIDWTADPTDNYWRDDTVEIFIDEDKSGGPHRGAEAANAFAYHLSTLGDNVDNFNNARTIFGNDHVEYKRIAISETKSVWEMAITVWGDDYTLTGNHTPVVLTEGKLMGFTMSYIDTDGNNGQDREHFIGSVDSEAHQNNQGFLNADGFGSLKLVK